MNILYKITCAFLFMGLTCIETYAGCTNYKDKQGCQNHGCNWSTFSGCGYYNDCSKVKKEFCKSAMCNKGVRCQWDDGKCVTDTDRSPGQKANKADIDSSTDTSSDASGDNSDSSADDNGNN